MCREIGREIDFQPAPRLAVLTPLRQFLRNESWRRIMEWQCQIRPKQVTKKIRHVEIVPFLVITALCEPSVRALAVIKKDISGCFDTHVFRLEESVTISCRKRLDNDVLLMRRG